MDLEAMTYRREGSILRIEQVCKSYGSKEVLSNVNTTIQDLKIEGFVAGQVVAFLGPSGVGKSTLLRILAGVEKPTSGGVYLDGSDNPIAAGQVGVVFQRFPLFPNRTVIGNLVVAGMAAGLKEADAESRAIAYLREFSMLSDMHSYLSQLSGGMQQRIALIRQLINQEGRSSDGVHLLLLDEPFSALDGANAQLACQTIRKVADRSEKNTVIVVTHDVRAALSVADMIWVMGKSPEGKGGTIIKELDVCGSGFCWMAGAFKTKEFCEIEAEIQAYGV